eukprot:Awhi_evm1s7387
MPIVIISPTENFHFTLDNEFISTPAGECCPICVIDLDCSLVKCAVVTCEVGQIAVKRPGQCCNTCVPDVVKPPLVDECKVVVCKDGEIAITRPGQCCEVCVPGVVGPPVQRIGCNSCSNGYNDGCNDCVCDGNGQLLGCTERACLLQGEPFCKPDCSTVLCLNPVCQ